MIRDRFQGTLILCLSETILNRSNSAEAIRFERKYLVSYLVHEDNHLLAPTWVIKFLVRLLIIVNFPLGVLEGTPNFPLALFFSHLVCRINSAAMAWTPN